MSESPVEVAIAVVEDCGRFLIGQRPSNVVLAGYWEFPGGKLEPGESPGEAAIRECREESGVEVRVRGVFPAVQHQYDHGLLRVHFLDCVPVTAETVPAAPFRWIDRGDLPKYRFPEANRALLEQLSKANDQ